MHAPAPKKEWNQRLIRSGFFVGAVLFHLILFLLVATWVVFKAPEPPATDAFQAVKFQPTPPPPPAPPPASGAAADNPQLEPQPVVVPVVTPPSIITSINSSFAVNAPKIDDQALSHLSEQAPQGSGLSQGAGDAGTGTAFGSSGGGGGPSLKGYLIDLKQTRDRTPTGIAFAKFYKMLGQYVSDGWHDSMFENYYRSHTVLHTDAFEIPAISSQNAPKAFGVEHDVKPSWWIAHYHGSVEAPQSGEYRFAGYADNVIFVRIGGKNVLDAGINLISSDAKLHEHLPFVVSTSKYKNLDGHLKIGPAFHMDAASPVNMDVLIGDDGGECAFFLLVEKVGNTYEKAPDGTPKYPFFQLSPKNAPTFQKGQHPPPYSLTPEPWQAVGD